MEKLVLQRRIVDFAFCYFPQLKFIIGAADNSTEKASKLTSVKTKLILLIS